MPPRTDMQVVIDLETTGSEVDGCEIIEVGAVLIDMSDARAEHPTFKELGRFTSLVQISEEGVERVVANPVVMDMHRKSGLFNDLTSNRLHKPTILEVDKMVVDWLKQWTLQDGTHVPLGGSGAGHFDRKFIAKYMPKLDKRITYWAYDVGVLRRVWELLGIPTHGKQGDKTHRALDDALFHVAEWRYYTQHLADTWRVYNIHANEDEEWFPTIEQMAAMEFRA